MKPRKPLPKVSKTPHKASKRFVPLSVLKEVKERSGGICECVWPVIGRCSIRCNRKAQRQPHHILQRSQGGKHTAENLLDVCFECHNWIENHKTAAAKLGLYKPYLNYSND